VQITGPPTRSRSHRRLDDPSAALGTIANMLLARIVCSDPLCAEELDVSVEELDELDSLICECGFGFVLVDVAELPQIGSVIAFPGQDRPADRRVA
jgi:hypothetical protein